MLIVSYNKISMTHASFPNAQISLPVLTLLKSIRSPLVILNRYGEKIASNDMGERYFQRRIPFLESLQAHFFPFRDFNQAWQDWMASDSPVSLATPDNRLILTPLDVGMQERITLLEWDTGPEDQALEILQAVGEAVNSSLILEDIFEALGDVLHRYIPYQIATIVILEDTQNAIKTLVRLLEDGSLEIVGENNVFAGYDAMVDTLLRDPKSLFYPKQQLIPPTLRQSLILSPDTASAIIVPLINKGVVVGLIAMVSSDEEIFREYHRNLLCQVSEQLALAVENAKFYWQTQAQAGREFLINQLTKAIRQSLDIDAILSTAVEELGRVTGVSRCFIRYFPKDPDSDPQVLRIFHYAMPGVRGFPEASPNDSAIPFEHRVFQSRDPEGGSYIYNPFILNDVADCPEYLEKRIFFQENEIKSLAVFPVLIRDTLVGTITLHQCDAYRVWVLEDIELFKAIAEHLGVALYQAQLFLELETRKSELEHTLQELQQAQVHLVQTEKMAVLGQFVAGIAHEVNTPLGTIAGNNDVLLRCLKKFRNESRFKNELNPKNELNSENLQENTTEIIKIMGDLLQLNRLATDRIREIVKNFRNFARLDESEMKTVDIHEGLESTLLLVKSAIPHNIRIIKHYDPNLPLLNCFPGLLNQVFMNMMVNAAHALANQNQGTITIRTEYLTRSDSPAMIQISFSDTGKGIAPEHLSKIFDPGFTTKGVGVGTGLGLALCFKIVQKHHGRILVESQPGQGAYFKVQIPLVSH